MRVLVTGGAGFIGSNLTRRLIELGHEVTILDNLSKQIHGEKPSESFLFRSVAEIATFIEGTVTSREDIAAAVDGQDAIVHLAAETGTGQSMYEIERYVSANIGGTALLLDHLAMTENSVKTLVVASSRSIYGEGKYISAELGEVYPTHRSDERMRAGQFEPDFPGSSLPLALAPTDEESRIHPSSVYGLTKQAQEQLVGIVANSLGIRSVALRYQNVYGPGQSLSNPYTGILSIFSTLIQNDRAINIFEDGLESRDFVYIDDVVDGTILALQSVGSANEIVNIGSGVPTSVLTVVDELFQAFGRTVPVTVSGNYRLGDIRHNFADLGKAREVLGFEPKVSFREGVTRFVDWVQSQPTMATGYEESLRELKAKNLFK